MATIVRTQTAPPTTLPNESSQDRRWQSLETNIPAPFPSQAEWEQEDLLRELENEELTIDKVDPFHDELDGPATRSSATNGEERDVESVATREVRITAAHSVLEGLQCSHLQSHPSKGLLLGHALQDFFDIIPSIAHVQKSCITTLNDLLSTTTHWRPIIPDRRHSMPPRPPSDLAISIQPSSALHTLVLNLRAQDPTSSASPSSLDTKDDAVLMHELQVRIDRLAAAQTLSRHDAVLVRTLASLIGHFFKLSTLQPTASASNLPRVASWSTAAPTGPFDSLTVLRRELSDLQLARGDSAKTSDGIRTSGTPVEQVEIALLWAHVDEELEQVLALCRARTSDAELLPPDYDAAWYDEVGGEGLPRYEAGSAMLTEEAKAGPSSPTEMRVSEERLAGGNVLSEKMRMDLEAVTLAIDRLYLVAPQLHDQRVELKRSKVEEMEKARLAGPSRENVREGKRRATEIDDVKDFDRIVDMIGRASDRKLVDQAVVLEGGLKARLERAQKRDREKRDAFVEQLMRHSQAGRMHSQDAVRTPPGAARDKLKDPNVMLTLPEFIREAVPETLQLKMQIADSQAMLTLPEFVKEPVPESAIRSPPRRTRSVKGARNRSMSAPPLAWLLGSSSRPSSRPTSPAPASPVEVKKSRSSKIQRVSSAITVPALQSHLNVHYVAEYHENLQHIIVFLSVSGIIAGVNLEAEVVPSSGVPGKTNDATDYLLLKCGLSTSPFLRLPARVAPGKQTVMVSGQHYEIKLAVSSPMVSSDNTLALLDGDRLQTLRPTSYLCASCSLPLVQCSQLRDYRDLPSEHWEELVDAWMCHSDQKLHEHVSKHSNEGFWPTRSRALVGGSYILFEQSVVVSGNLARVEELIERKHVDDWQRVRCICGAIVGRCQQHRPAKMPPSVVYRLAKYAIRPLSPTIELPKIPLSAFIAEDMNEFVHAHATYRFIIFDEEEERPRILVWLFKPSMRMAYITPTEYIIPKSGSIHAAKVLFKILGPSTVYSDLHRILSKYPGFPQAEHLHYPLDICWRLAGLLKESNTGYPKTMRTMTDLDVGWLQRA
ncbi:uncharacterized protein FIBRA_00728 [Fibroporia radiculosa]|uniref:HECT domain-containing protein n=1 Tax=Fibroporia radiculosa TaxID=599839 RepID=J4G0K5_9APHY|nr:uncharacterized protein FIBRA_00728 [Fibroporia radiculosa]CCL98723.1 predicted protein [Fibroporia radiculosa]